jgi:hypothetical protein
LRRYKKSAFAGADFRMKRDWLVTEEKKSAIFRVSPDIFTPKDEKMQVTFAGITAVKRGGFS